MRHLLLIPLLLLAAALPATAHSGWQQRCEPPRRRVIVVQPEPRFHTCQRQGMRHDHGRCEARREVRLPRHRPHGPLIRFGIGF